MTSGQMVTFSAGGTRAEGFVARPGPGKPGVIVIQEWWGLVAHVKDVVQRYASLGYVAMAPDLYHGKSTLEAEEASHLMSGLDWARAVEEIGGAVKYLRDVEGCDRVGVTGFCMGGALTMLAASLPGVDAYAAYYGFPPKDAGDAVDRITAPGVIFFGEQEDFFSVPDAQAFAERQRQAGRACEVVVYPGAGHAFFNNDRPEAYVATAANDAWRRTLALFGQYLRSVE
jgi:carboxymethylenebutenolidase